MLARGLSLPFCAGLHTCAPQCSGDDEAPTPVDDVFDWINGPAAHKLDLTSEGALFSNSPRNARADTLQSKRVVSPPTKLRSNPQVQHTATARQAARSEEESNWDTRRELTGIVARLVSYTGQGEHPRDDVHFRGGAGHHIVVAAVQCGGLASKMGVKPGDRLVSVNGSKDLLHLSAEKLAASLSLPTVLVFAGFVGSLKAEVRVCDVGPQSEVVCRGFPTVEGVEYRLCEERVFGVTGATSLFLAVDSHAATSTRPEVSEGQALLELRRREAARLKQFALACAVPSDDMSHEGTIATPRSFGCMSDKNGDLRRRRLGLGRENASIHFEPGNRPPRQLHPEETPEPDANATGHGFGLNSRVSIRPNYGGAEASGNFSSAPVFNMAKDGQCAPKSTPAMPVLVGDEENAFEGMDECETFTA